MKIKHLIPAEDDTVFARGAFASQIGKTIRFNVGERTTTAVILAVDVAEDGRSAEMTLDVDDDLPELGGRIK